MRPLDRQAPRAGHSLPGGRAAAALRDGPVTAAVHARRAAGALRAAVDRPAVRVGLLTLGLVLLGLIWLGLVPYDTVRRDAHAYWAVDPVNPYLGARLGGEDAFLYSPAAAQLAAWASALPYEVFRGLWSMAQLGTLLGLGAGWLLPLPPVLEEIVRGNIHLFLAAAIVAGFRFPAAWAFVILTKVTPAVGIAWFTARGEWRALTTIGLAVSSVVAVSVAVGGAGLWWEWLGLLGASAGSAAPFAYLGVAPPPLVLRLPLAALLAAWGGRTDRRWTVPLAAIVALPVIWPSGFALVAALPATLGSGPGRRLRRSLPGLRGRRRPRVIPASAVPGQDGSRPA